MPHTRLGLVVFDVESEDEPRLLGTYEATDEAAIAYTDTDGRLRHAPQDCVVVAPVEVRIADGSPAAAPTRALPTSQHEETKRAYREAAALVAEYGKPKDYDRLVTLLALAYTKGAHDAYAWTEAAIAGEARRT